MAKEAAGHAHPGLVITPSWSSPTMVNNCGSESPRLTLSEPRSHESPDPLPCSVVTVGVTSSPQDRSRAGAAPVRSPDCGEVRCSQAAGRCCIGRTAGIRRWHAAARPGPREPSRVQQTVRTRVDRQTRRQRYGRVFVPSADRTQTPHPPGPPPRVGSFRLWPDITHPRDDRPSRSLPVDLRSTMVCRWFSPLHREREKRTKPEQDSDMRALPHPETRGDEADPPNARPASRLGRTGGSRRHASRGSTTPTRRR
jgi:hypothetical protein